jgi:hypothetical protein
VGERWVSLNTVVSLTMIYFQRKKYTFCFAGRDTGATSSMAFLFYKTLFEEYRSHFNWMVLAFVPDGFSSFVANLLSSDS